MHIKIFQPQGIHELGRRDNQEDTIYPELGQATADTRLFMVCDGMGGHSFGELASQTVCQTISEMLTPMLDDDKVLTDGMIETALSRAYDRLEKCEEDVLLKHKTDGTRKVGKMGTTLTLLALHGGGVTVAHIGDSRIYHIRPAERRILYRSRDHSLVMELFQMGEISFADMATSQQRNIITRAIQPGEKSVDADITHITDVKPGDVFLLCSDGITEQMATDDRLLDIVCSNDTDEKKCLQLMKDTANNSDNHSAYILRVDSVTSQADDANLVADEAVVRHNLINVAPALAYGGDAVSPSHNAHADEDVSIHESHHDPEAPMAQQAAPMRYPEPQDNGKSGKSMLMYVLAALIAALACAAVYYFFFRKPEPPKITPEGTNLIDRVRDSIRNEGPQPEDETPTLQPQHQQEMLQPKPSSPTNKQHQARASSGTKKSSASKKDDVKTPTVTKEEAEKILDETLDNQNPKKNSKKDSQKYSSPNGNGKPATGEISDKINSPTPTPGNNSGNGEGAGSSQKEKQKMHN